MWRHRYRNRPRRRPAVSLGATLPGAIEDVAERMVSSLWAPVGVSNSKCPILDGMASGEPFVGPGKHKSPSRPHEHRLAHVSGQELGLRYLAVPQGVDADLPEQERLVSDQVLEPEQVAPERFQIVQVDVEGDEIKERNIQVLGRWEVGVGHQAVGVRLLGDVHELGQETLDPTHAVPADDIGGDLVADVVSEHARVLAAPFGSLTYQGARLTLKALAGEKAKMLGPRNIDQSRHSVLVQRVQKPFRRHVVSADGVDANCLHPGKVVFDLIERWEGLAGGVRGKRTVGGPLDTCPVRTRAKNLPSTRKKSRMPTRAPLLVAISFVRVISRGDDAIGCLVLTPRRIQTIPAIP